MLEKKMVALLKILDANIGATYKVMTKIELVALLPASFKYDNEALESALNFLSDKGYINIKYSDEQEICLCTTARSKAYLEHNGSNVERAKLTRAQHLTLFGIVVGASFLGTLIAGLILQLIS